MPVLNSDTDAGSELVFRILKYALDPANGLYFGTLVIGQFRRGLVPAEVQDTFRVYGSLYDSTGKSLDTRISPQDPLAPNESEELQTQTVQISIWGPLQGEAEQASFEVRNLLRKFPVPVIFPEVIVADLLPFDAMTIHEEQHVFHTFFDVRLELQT